MHQQVISPSGAKTEPQPTAKQEPAKQASASTVSPDIMRLANNNDLSISTLAHEAHRLQNEEEVEISLR